MITEDNTLDFLLSRTCFVSFGTDHFDYDGFREIKNGKSYSVIANKPLPHTGLWASPEKSQHGWFDWCSEEHFRDDENYWTNYFIFRLTRKARVLYVDSYDAFISKMSPYFNFKEVSEIYGIAGFYVDYEKMKEDYDAVWLTAEGEVQARYPRDMCDISEAPCLYGWDCESLFVLNKDVVIEVANSQHKMTLTKHR